MRLSQLLLPTVKEDPAGAEAVSHKLMVRAGLVRQLAAGIYIFLPAGWRVMRKIESIIREEMDAIGCQELLMPVMHPAEVWQESGRWDEIGEEMFRLKDRKGADMALAMTHEEIITWIAAREVRSYKQLPQLWYHIQTKERDEARPKSGILRTREFIMKDSYSLDRDIDGLQESYQKHIAAYDRIMARCGLETLMVLSDPGMMGGAVSHEYMAPSEAGEDVVVFCRSCGYAANVELAVAGAEEDAAGESGAEDAGAGAEGAGAAAPYALPPAGEHFTPGAHTIDEVSAFLHLPARAFMKSLVVMTEGDDAHAIMVCVRGEHDLCEPKLRKLIGEFRLATAEEVVAAQGTEAGFVGPVPTPLPVIADEVLRRGVYVAGANKPDHHLSGVSAADLEQAAPAGVRFADLREARAGDPCPECEGSLESERVIEVGNIFQLGTKYSKPMGATYLDEAGKEQPIIMGSYGIGLARIAAAAVEQNHDERGIVWPASIAPYAVHLVLVRAGDETQRALAERLYDELPAAGFEVVFDDREVSAGIKFADADLLGCPAQVVVGKRAAEGVVELKSRASGERDEVAVHDLGHALRALLAGR
jgi:prolyl-tRNA synthetase